MQKRGPAIIELDAAMRSGRIQHDGNLALGWYIGSVVGKPDRRGNFYPTKARPEQKIDAAMAMIMAIGRSMTEPNRALTPVGGSFGMIVPQPKGAKTTMTRGGRDARYRSHWMPL